MSAQIRRAAASVCANIAEGTGRRSTKELVQFLTIARGSLAETTCFIALSKDLGFIEGHVADELEHRYRGLDAGLNALQVSLQKSGS
jgi:four helix bundle protein